MNAPRRLVLATNNAHFATESFVLEARLEKSAAVCFHDPNRKIGAMLVCNAPQAKRLVKETLQQFKAAGTKPRDLTIKVVSSGDSHATGHDELLVYLRGFGLNIKAESAEPSRARDVRFETQTGELRFRTAEAALPRSVSGKKIEVLIVDDSASIRKVIKHLIELDPELAVIGEAVNPQAAAEFRRTREPDVMTLDMEMPGMSGLEYLREFMPAHPLPTIIITNLTATESDSVLLSLEAGAFDYMRKPAMTELSGFASNLHAKIRAAANSAARIKRRREFATASAPVDAIKSDRMGNSFIAMGASTGGTEALRQVLTQLPKEIPPVFIVQHMAPAFIESFAKRLDAALPYKVKAAVHGELAQPNTVYIAPGGYQMRLANEGARLKIMLSDDDAASRFKPAVDCLFQSASLLTRFEGVGVILSGMGSDGADGLLRMRDAGFTTIAQDERTSIVFGMPKVAIEKGGAEHVSPIGEIASVISRAVNGAKRTKRAA